MVALEEMTRKLRTTVQRFFSGLHGRILAISLGLVAAAIATQLVIFLTINRVSLTSYFESRNRTILEKIEKLVSVPFLKQDYIMMVDIIDAEAKSSDLDYIWVLDEKRRVIASNDESQVLSVLSPVFMRNPLFMRRDSPEGFSIAMIPSYSLISEIGFTVLLWSSLSFLLLLAALIALTTRLSHRLADPIEKAVKSSHEISLGRFDISLGSSPVTEINTLFRSLTDTASRLKELTSNLKMEKNLLKESEEKFRRLIENLPDTYFFYSYDNAGMIRYVSPSVFNVLGYAADDISEPIYTFFTRNPANKRARKLSDLSLSGVKQRPYEIEVRHQDGSKRLLEVFEMPVKDGVGNVILVEGIARDITAKRKEEEQVLQAQKMETVGTLAGGIAHDFNNLLGGIVGIVSILKYKHKRGNLSGNELTELIGVMEESGNRAADMVKRILALSRKQDFNFAPVDLSEIIEHVRLICESSFDKSVTIKTECAPGAFAMADRALMEQMILNLCVNAGHAMTIMRGANEPWGGSLAIRLRRIDADAGFCQGHPECEEGPYWLISVSDNGVGMDSRTAAKIFDPFFTTKEKGKGTGLGLAMAYNTVKQHGGFIDVYSEKGTGTAMNVYIPVYEGTVEGVSTDSPGDDLAGTGTILVIDDEAVMRNMSKSMLESCGYEVITAAGGDEGVEAYRERPGKIDAVLLDLAMPGKTGVEVYRELKAIDPSVRVLLTSGYEQDARVTELAALGIHGFIHKPYTLGDLVRMIKHTAENSERP